MTSRHIAVLIFDGFADWEPSFALTGVRRWGQLSVVSYGYSRDVVTSMGGLRVVPDCSLSELVPSEVRLLILPGGDVWLADYPQQALLHSCLKRLVSLEIPVAAICAATTALARTGVFVDRRHTSNGASYLSEHAPGYQDPSLYRDLLAVRHRAVITASGLGAVEFAREIFAELGILGEADLALFQRMYRGAQSVQP